MIRTTHTYAIMEVSRPTYEEIKAKLIEVDYRHALHEENPGAIVLDMHGIALASSEKELGSKERNEIAEILLNSIHYSYGRQSARQWVDAVMIAMEAWRKKKTNL